jgi:serine/threonine-protein kinase
MAPEQIAGDGLLTDRADIYAVGVILYLLVTGSLPIDADHAHELMLRKLTDEPARLTGVAPAHADLVAQCLARAPASRPSAASLAASLRSLADQEGAPSLEAIAAVNPDTIETAVQRVRRT